MARPGLMRHRKFIRLARILQSEALAMGHLEIIWQACYEAGDAKLGAKEDVEFLARWQGEPGKLVTAMSESGFIDADDQGGYSVHDLFDHAPEYVQARAKREHERRKDRVCAHCKKEFHSAESHAKYCSSACRQSAYRDSRVTRVTHNVTQALRTSDAPPSTDVTGALRTTEKGEGENTAPVDSVTQRYAPVTDSYTTPSPSPSPSLNNAEGVPSACPEPDEPASGPEQTPLLIFPTKGKVKEWPLYPAKVAELKAAFPDLDILAECKKALAWCYANPPRQKSDKGMGRFLFFWVEKAQNQGRAPPLFANGRADLDEQFRQAEAKRNERV